jgi:hypothetical protein
MADSTDSWAGMAPFVNAVFANQNKGADSTQSSFENIAKGLLGSHPAQAKHEASALIPPGMQKDPIGAAGVGIIGPGGIVPGIMAGTPQTPMVPPQKIETPVSATSANPAMPMPSISPITGPAAIPTTSNPFITGTPNPSGSQVS